MGLWTCPTHGLYGGEVFCPKCGETGAYTTVEPVSVSPRSDGREVEAVEALEWYAEQVAGCRKLGRFGDPFRNALDRDGGQRVRAAIEAMRAHALTKDDQEGTGR